jgi:hypothetical protein
MLKFFSKCLIFPFLGMVFTVFYLLYVGYDFSMEEIKFEPLSSQPSPGQKMEGVTEMEWEGKRVLSLKERQTFFYFSLSPNKSFNLKLKYYLRFNPKGERIKILINHSPLTEVSLRPSSKSPNQISLTIPFSSLQAKGNYLEIIRSQLEPKPLYLEYLKIRNVKGYSTGLLTAYLLPLPLNPPLLSKINWNVHKGLFLFFISIYSLFGIIYGFILSRHRKIPFATSLGKGVWVMLPALILFLIVPAISLVISGHILLSLKSFVILNAGLTVLAIAIQLKLIRLLSKSSKSVLQRILKKKEMFILFLITVTSLSVLFLFSLKFNKNITGFMVIGDYFQAPQIWTPKTLIYKGSVGYDGQFYYYMAHDPLILGKTYDHIDFPAYRYQRIIYPLTVWLLSFGQSNWIPYLMVGVNLLGILLGTWFIILILKYFGLSPWYSLFYFSFWGFLLSLLRCLPEPLAITFIVIAVFSFFKGKILWQILSLSLAALTQETTLLVSLAFLLYYFQGKDFRRSTYMLLPLLAYFLWQLYLYYHFQIFSFLGGTQNFGPPFLGIMQKFISLGPAGFSFEKVAELLYLLLVFSLIVIAFYQIFIYYNPLTLSFLGYALMTALLNNLIWVEPWSYARATLGLLVFNLLIFTKEKTKLNLFPMFLIPIILLFSLFSMRLL